MRSRAWLALPFSLALLTGCESFTYAVAGASVVELSTNDAAAAEQASTVDIFIEGPSPDVSAPPVSEILAAARDGLEARGFKVGVIAQRSDSPLLDLDRPKHPVLILDAMLASETQSSLYPGLAGRVALLLPDKDGAALDYVFYLPYGGHAEDAKKREHHLQRAIDEALEDLPRR